MKWIGGKWVWVAALLLIQAVEIFNVVRQESLTFDEDDHIFAGYSMWKTGDFGLNPEHPPLVKLLATSVILGETLQVPALKGRPFKEEAYLDGRDFLWLNDPDHGLLLRMRLAAGALALMMTLAIFAAGQEWFGPQAGLIAMTIAVFDPNLLAHSALVTTDMALSCFLLLSVLTFYRWASRPTWLRLVLTGLAAGGAIGSKHSGILLAPMLVSLALVEVARAAKDLRARTALRMAGGLVAAAIIAVALLWSLYGFRYAARPAGLALSTSLTDYMKPLGSADRNIVSAFAHWRLLPESYLMGLVDVRRVAQDSPTYILGHVYAHGVWWYFPTAILIKTTLGLMLLITLAGIAAATGKLKHWREIAYIVLPGLIYLVAAMTSGLNIGARHILPLFALGAVLAGSGAWALIQSSRRWAYVAGILIAWHVGSALAVYPVDMAYANEAWGGPHNVHRYLSDANVDWAQQLVQVKAWQDRHPHEECWFAYFARPEIDPAMWGVRCHALPTIDTLWLGGADRIPTVIDGAVLISAGDLSGCEWPTNRVNPYARFQAIRESEQIDDGVMVYRGEFAVPEAAGMSQAQWSDRLRGIGKTAEALDAARAAVQAMPDGLIELTALGDSEAAVGDTSAAKTAYARAIAVVNAWEPDAQAAFLPDLERKIGKL